MSDNDPSAQERSFSALPQPESPDSVPRPEPRRLRGLFEAPEGALGIFFLVLLAAVLGGLVTVYWPWLPNASDSTVANDRLTALETRVGQIAAGHAPKAAAEMFDDTRRDMAALKDRVDADEARIMAVEKTSGQTEGVDVTALKGELDKSASDLAQLAARMAKLEQAPAIASRLNASDKALGDLRKDLQTADVELAKLDGRIGALERNAPPADLSARLDSLATKSSETALDVRVAKLESQDMAGLVRRAASVLALADLARASEGAGPFQGELMALRTFVPGAPEVNDLARYARTGAPTAAALADRFTQNADGILAAERQAGAQNWLQRLWINLVNLVSVRRVGEIAGDSSEARVARAEVDLSRNNLDAAVSEISGLKGVARTAAAPWLADAQARLAISHDLRGLSRRIVADFAAPPAATPVAAGTAP
jgi:hypothetical protein